jgi:hypothetical protein
MRPPRPAPVTRALSLLVALAAAVLAPAATSAAAAGGWQPVNGAERGLLTDGARYVVTVSRSRAVRAIDTGHRAAPPPRGAAV